MSKTIELQIEKSRVLVEGLNKNIESLRAKGISEDSLQSMTNDLNLLKEANDECDKAREELSLKVKRMNQILAGVKEAFAEKKRIIKTSYPQEQWINYGVQDKRLFKLPKTLQHLQKQHLHHLAISPSGQYCIQCNDSPRIG